ncbi:3-oxoacyl-[acyl-carrier protein] reductase [Marininema mesophilum]|uniref:3-oxoacyl-[acyl-carrier protein] reductase n=1 Tax=Marininema mesophilum TaxID=1048340 RepID=A0A1H3CFU4_9BACL|nr:SDR family oxidoreductase [Marininema mesophilum]SDX52464.1 3-oxoacyl-[acyl-carrier protein] reductase [Marininema mesophilum]
MLRQERGVALILGSSRGLGKMTARVLAEAGWDLGIHCKKNEEAAFALQKQVTKAGRRAAIFRGDLSRHEETVRVVTEAVNHFGGVDVLIHAVGPFIRERKRFTDLQGAEIESMVDGNLKSALFASHTALPVMRERGMGRVIFFGFGRVNEAPAWPDRSAYAAAKSGLVSLTKTLAVEEAPYGITVNMVCPGDIIGDNKEKWIKDVQGERDAETPRGRPGVGEDVARVVRFLCEPASDFVTGNVINVTGGLDVIHPVSKAKN